MIRFIICSGLFLFIVGCSNAPQTSNQTTQEEDMVTPTATAATDFPLFSKYDCLACHKVEEKLQGPAYIDIANKYAGRKDAVNYLTQKIIAGGSGVWGDVPMNAHPGMPQSDAEKMATYILSLKK